MESRTSVVERSAGVESGQTYRGPFAIMTVLFFMWGFMTVWNDVLIPRFKEAFELNYFQAMLVQFAFFGAYGIGAFVYYIVSMVSGDPINRIGYKNGVVIGLVIAAAGSALFYPAALLTSYHLFLIALFVVGLGFAMLQIAANPYVTILGPERTASSRLNLSQAFNSFGTTIGPLIGGWLIFTFFTSKEAHGADSVKYPYLCFAAVFAVLAVVFSYMHLPNFSNTEKIERGIGALRHPHTVLGMVAIFMYVGGEVTVGSAMINYLGLPKLGGLSHEAASKFLAFYWGGLMIGRFMGAFALSDMPKARKHCLGGACSGDSLHHGLGALGQRERLEPGWTIGAPAGGLLPGRSERAPDARPVWRGHHRTAAHQHVHLGRSGDVEHPGGGPVLFGDVVQHFCTGHRRARALEEPGVLAAGDGHPGRGNSPAVAGGDCGPL